MAEYLEKDEVLKAIQKASEEIQMEISEDKAGFFNATTVLETFKEKLKEKLDVSFSKKDESDDYDLDLDY